MKTLLAAAALALTVSAAYAQTPAKAEVEVPADVKTYVTTHPSTPIPYASKVLVGHGLDGEIVWLPLPYPAYRWTNLNGQQVLVEKRSGHVVAVY